MDSSSNVLKQEINDTQAAQHDLVKWKLIVTAALGAAAFGITGSPKPNLWLLFFIPFVCAYVDLYDYQYRLHVLVIAKFLREKGRDPEMKEYEGECERVRENCTGDFNLGKWAGLGSSVVASVIAPLFYFIGNPVDVTQGLVTIPRVAGVLVWLGSVVLIFVFYWGFRRKEDKLAESPTGHPAGPPPHLPPQPHGA